MLGEQIGEETGKVQVRRVISVDGGTKVEVTVQSTGKLLGIETRNNVTYLAGIRPDGSLYGEAQGLVVGKGGEQASFKAAGVGKLLDGGAVSYRDKQRMLFRKRWRRRRAKRARKKCAQNSLNTCHAKKSSYNLLSRCTVVRNAVISTCGTSTRKW